MLSQRGCNVDVVWGGEVRGIKCYLRGAAMLVWSGEERFGVEWY